MSVCVYVALLEFQPFLPVGHNCIYIHGKALPGSDVYNMTVIYCVNLLNNHLIDVQ